MSSALLGFEDNLRMASFFGLFPCYFDKEGNLQARNRWAFYLRSLFFFSILFGLLSFATWYFINAAPEESQANLMKYFQWYVASSPDFLDKMAFATPPMLTLVNGIYQILVIGSKAKTNLCLQEKFEDMPKGNKSLWNIYKNLIM